jgi:hypothetical protein
MGYGRKLRQPQVFSLRGSSIISSSFAHFTQMLITFAFLQIRIVKNSNEKNPKKQHRGYAFIVYEREKDMKGTIFSPTQFVYISVHA